MSATVPTMEEFDALAARVAELEGGTTPEPPEPEPEPPAHDFAAWFAGPNKNTELAGDRIKVAGEDRWLLLDSNYGSGNNQREWNHPDQWTSTPDGLNVHGQRKAMPNGYEFAAGFASSRDVGVFYPLFSRFVFEALIPRHVEDWPAFWLRHRNGSGFAEVDILEMFVAQTRGSMAHMTIHEAGMGGGSNMHQPKFELPDDDDFHELVCEIAPHGSGGLTIEFLVDGAGPSSFGKKYNGLDVFTLDDASGLIGAGTEDAWDVAMNLALGGNWLADPRVPYVGKLQNGQDGNPLGPDVKTWRDEGEVADFTIRSVTIDRIA